MAPPTIVCLTIAGSDCSGGAGAQADLKTFEAWRVFGTSALTLITAQNTRGVQAVEFLSDKMVTAQLNAVLDDFVVRSAKIGALGHVGIIDAVADVLDARGIERLVVDPVMVSKHGDRLFDQAGEQRLVERIFPHASLITPNHAEATALLGWNVDDDNAQDGALALLAQYDRPVLLTGGAGTGAEAIDWLAFEGESTRFAHERIGGHHQHGAGCTLSAAIAAALAHNMPLPNAIEHARGYVRKAMQSAPRIGHGEGPLHHHIDS